MAKAPSRSGKPASRRPKAAASAKRPVKSRRSPGAVAPLPPEDLARARIHVTTIGDLLLTAADRHPDALALVFPDRTLTYRQLADGALRRARALQALGVRPRDHVGVLMHTCAEFVETFFAIAFCGGVIVPINARYKSNELAYVIENGDLVTVVTTDAVADSVDFVERLNGAFKDLPRSRNPRQLKVGRRAEAAQHRAARQDQGAGIPHRSGFRRGCQGGRRDGRAPSRACACACATSA